MIKFQIITCPNKKQVGVYQHWEDSLTIGRNCEGMVIDEPNIAPEQVRVYRKKDFYGVVNLAPEIGVTLNGTPLMGEQVLKVNDTILIAKTSISFRTLDDAVPTPLKKQTNKKIEALLKDLKTPEGVVYKSMGDFIEKEEKKNTPFSSPPPPSRGKKR